jgi:hypothetical protein
MMGSASTETFPHVHIDTREYTRESEPVVANPKRAVVRRSKSTAMKAAGSATTEAYKPVSQMTAEERPLDITL